MSREAKVEIVPLGGDVAAPPIVPAAPGEDRKERRRRIAERGRERLRYPPWCRPATELGQSFVRRPHEMVLPLANGPSGPGHIVVRMTQDRDALLPGEAATLTVETARDDKPVPLRITSSSLTFTPPQGSDPTISVAFRDDGAPPDAARADDVWTAEVRLPTAPPGDSRALSVALGVTSEDETSELHFRLERRTAPPARFTGSVKESIVDGDVVFEIGVDVARSGTYAIMGHLYDREHRGMALLTATAALDRSEHVIRLRAFGKLLRDLGVAPPWELRDVDGWLDDPGHVPDRAFVPMWRGPHRTKTIPLTALDNREWTDIQKAKAVPPIPGP